MKRKINPIAISALIILASCSIKSLHPIYDESTLISNQDLIGSWQDEDGGIYIIQTVLKESEDKSKINLNLSKTKNLSKHTHLLKLKEHDSDSIWIEMYIHFIDLDNTIFWDLFPEGAYSENLHGVLAENLLPVHTFGKVVLKKGDLWVYYFQSEWLEDLFEHNRIRIPHENIITQDGSITVLTASTKELQQFIVKYQNETKAFEEPLILKRIKK